MSVTTRRFIKIALLLLVGSALIAWFLFAPKENLNFAGLAKNQAALKQVVAIKPTLTVALFAMAYVISAALALPLTTLFSLAAGLLFGLGLGLVLVVIAATLGASLAFLFSRFLLGEWVQKKFQGKLVQGINDGVKKNGIYFLLFVRLVPLFPFFLINLVAALTPMRFATFFLGTAIGIIPGSFVFVNAGRALGEIKQASDILSPVVLGSFALLGLFALIPIAYKKLRIVLSRSV